MQARFYSGVWTISKAPGNNGDGVGNKKRIQTVTRYPAYKIAVMPPFYTYMKSDKTYPRRGLVPYPRVTNWPICDPWVTWVVIDS